MARSRRGGWRATHRIATELYGSFEVMLADGCAYTFPEWETETPADFEVGNKGEWLFQGQPFTGEIEELVR